MPYYFVVNLKLNGFLFSAGFVNEVNAKPDLNQLTQGQICFNSVNPGNFPAHFSGCLEPTDKI